MSLVVTIALVALAVIGCALAMFLSLEVAAAILVKLKPAPVYDRPYGSVCVVIPAHNEADGIRVTLENVGAQLRAGDHMLVVADNCTDDTARIARDCGAEVIERNDPDRRGKGFALQFALDQLRSNPPAVVVFADADCQFAPGSLQLIAGIAANENRPAQALYLMKARNGSGPRLVAAEFAWAFLNNVRMRGLQALFNVTRFTGAGFAAPWSILAAAELASGEIVEDLAFTLQLVKQGDAVLFVPDALITSEFPQDDAALTRQAARWSIGSMNIAAGGALGAFIHGVKKGNPAQIGLAIDLMTPPLTIFIAMLFALSVASLLAMVIFGGATAFVISLLALFLAAGAVAAGWFNFCREILPLSAFPGILSFLASKASVFGKAGRRSAKQWTPTRSGAKDVDE